MMKKIVQLILKFLARAVLKKYRPEVIGITGSIGKTSAKEAVYALLKTKFDVRRSTKNYNNELGVPLSILGIDSPGRSISGWLNILIKSLKLIFKTDASYPKILILEMGVDHIGDMEYLTSIVRPNIGIVTSVSQSHLENFGSIDLIKKEKQCLVENLYSHGRAILNYDNEYTRQMASEIKYKFITFGRENGAMIQAQDLKFNFTSEGEVNRFQSLGMTFKLQYKGSVVPMSLPNVISYAAVYAVLSAAAVGVHYNFNLVEISSALASFKLPNGRMNLIEGLNGSFIIDDTYNASPESTIAAFKILEELKVPGKKILALGDMLELGSYAEEGHYSVGLQAAKLGIDGLVLVGERSRDIARGAIAGGLAENLICSCGSISEAASKLRSELAEGDLVFAKASQGIRMERLVKEIMAEPERASELLVRQSKDWTLADK